MSILDKAKARAATPTKTPNKSTTWHLAELDPLNGMLQDLVRLHAQAKQIEGQIEECKAALLVYGDQELVAACVAEGDLPPAPIKIQSVNGQGVSFVVQDRCAQASVSDDQVEELRKLLGEEKAESLLLEDTSFALNQQVLALPMVSTIVESHLERAVEELRGLIGEQADTLIVAKSRRGFVPGTLGRIGEICGRSKSRTASFLRIMASAATRFIKI